MGLNWRIAPLAGAMMAAVVAVSGVSAAQGGARSLGKSCELTLHCQGGTVPWLEEDGGVMGGRYTPLAKINTGNVKSLKLVWSYKSSYVSTEDDPVVVGNVAYVAAGGDHLFALNATSGRVLWTFNPTINRLATWGPIGPRSVAYGNDTVFLAAGNCVIYALNAQTGSVNWHASVCNPAKGWGETGAPIYYHGRLYIGSAGSDLGARGFIDALSATSGKLLWKWYTVPPNGQGWNKTGTGGGGDVWNTVTLDPATNQLFAGTGNPSPDFYNLKRPGRNPYTDSIVALNMTTGKFEWAYDEVPNDMWDYDEASPPTIINGAQNGLLIGDAGKSGIWYEVSAKSGQLMTSPLPVVKIDHPQPPLKGKPLLVWPGTQGGVEWEQSAYDPQTGLVYVEGRNQPFKERAKAGKYGVGQIDIGTTYTPAPKGTPQSGTLTAINGANGALVWQDKTPSPLEGGVTATAGGVGFFGNSGDGQLEAFNTTTGKVLWSYNTHKRIDTGPSIYSVNGKEYILVSLGGSTLGIGGLGGRLNASDAEWMCFEVSR